MPASPNCRAAFAAICFMACAAPAFGADYLVAPVDVQDMKAVFARVESRDVVPARARIGGTLVQLEVTEGSAVKQGQRIAVVADDKLALQLKSADARIRAVESELANARTELSRARDLLSRGAGTQQRADQLRTQTEVLENQANAAKADRAVIVQQSTEGQVLSPASGRVTKVPVTRGGVVMPGEAIATISGGGLFLRLAIPERHAPLLKQGSKVSVIGKAGATPAEPAQGELVKIYPQIENGRVIADVEVPGLGDFFTGERVLVRVPVAQRKALTVPAAALTTRSGIDFLKIAGAQGEREIAVVPGGMVETAEGARLEILSGLVAGDKVILP